MSELDSAFVGDSDRFKNRIRQFFQLAKASVERGTGQHLVESTVKANLKFCPGLPDDLQDCIDLLDLEAKRLFSKRRVYRRWPLPRQAAGEYRSESK
jgi:hypothetical protein